MIGSNNLQSAARMIISSRILANWWFYVLVVSLYKAALIESVNITLTPDNPTKVLINSDVTLHWNYSLGLTEFREVTFERTRVGADQRIGIIWNSRSGQSVLYDAWALNSGRFEIRTPATLVIRNLTTDDASNYGVEFQAFLGATLVRKESVIYLDVLVPAKFTSTPSNKTINETQTVTFLCSATGNPMPNITWLSKDGNVLGTGEQLSFVVNRNQSGLYVCSADNALNVTVNSSAYLDVQFKPENTELSVDTSNTSAVLLNSTIVFNCSTSSHPPVHYFLFYHNQLLLGSNASGFYYLRMTRSGVYSCTPVNKAGVGESASVNLTVVDLPRVSITQLSNIVVEGENLTLYCRAVGIPTPSVTWRKVGSPVILSQSETLKLINVTRPGTPTEELGYQCTGVSGIGNASTDITTVTVHYSSQIVRASSNKTVVENNNVMLHCNATGSPTPNITWTKDDNPTVLYQGNEFTIVNISRQQHGRYKCIAWNGVGQVANASFSVNVLYEPAISVQQCPSPMTEGNNVTLFCNAIGHPTPNITWTHQSTGAILSTTEELVLPVVTRYQAGQYRCIASNGVGNNSTRRCSLDVLYAPTGTNMTLSPSNTTVLRGSTVTLNCSTDANPDPHEFLFYFNESYLGNSSSGLFNASVGANGVYSCIPTNTVGIGHSESLIMSAVDTPSVDVYPMSSIVVEGNNITLSCNASGKPEPVISWAKVGEAGQVLSQSSSLTVTNVTRPGNPDHMIQYQCTASNGVESPATVIANITVHYPPEIITAPSSQHVVEGKGIVLLCNVTGYPRPNITWTKHGNNSVLSTTEILNVTRLMRGDNGAIFKCKVQNRLGSAEASATITVLYEPEILVQQCPSPITEGDNVTLFCNATGNPASNITWIRQSTGSKLSTTEELVLRAITRFQGGHYQCIAFNGIRNNSTRMCSLDVLYAPTGTNISLSPSNTTVLRGSTVTLNCSTDANSDPHEFQFYFNDSYLGNSSSGLFNVSVDADAVYSCVPINTVGTGHNATVTVIAVDAPSVDVYPTSSIVVEGNNITLSCNASGKPEPVISWAKVGEAGQVLSQSSSFTVTNVTSPRNPDHMIQYQCTASNGVENPATVITNITVLHPPTGTNMTLSPSNTTVLRGSTVTLICSTDANPDPHEFQFYFNDSYLGNSSSGLFNVSVNDDGVYSCVPINIGGLGRNAYLAVKTVDAPSVDVYPTSSIVVEGNNITLSCNASGKPEPVISWAKVDESGQVLSQSSSLTVTNVTRPGNPDHMIQYQCTASNGVESPATVIANITVHYAPQEAVTPSSTTIIEGNDVILFCNATGNPEPNVTWTRAGDNITLSASEILRLKNLTRLDNGAVYKCSLMNYIGSAEASAVITVYYPPVIESRIDNQAFVEGSNTTLYCNASGNPTPSITWTKDGNHTVMNQGETYSVVNIRREDAGDYTCAAWNGVGERTNATAAVTVYYMSKISQKPTSKSVLEGVNVTLYCNATGNPSPNITWTKDGNSAVLYQGETFKIINAQRNAAGLYTCTAWNGVGGKSIATATVAVHYESAIDIALSNTTVVESDNATLYCNATGNPPPNITWTKDGNQTVLNQGETYIISNIQRQAAGDYTCTAWNGVGNRTSATATLNVHYPSSVGIRLDDKIVLESSNVTLHCNATGNPTPNITWTKDGSSTVLHHGETYNVVNIQRRDAGDYTCTAWNGVGERTNDTATVTLHHPSVIESSPGNEVVLESTNLTLYCNATGNPTPNITWTKDGNPAVLHQGETYDIVRIQRQAGGKYTCTAWNGVGEQTNATATVTVLYPSSIDAKLSNETIIEGSNLTLHCNATGNPKPNINWTKDGSPRELHHGETYEIVNIQRNDAGDYTCTAWNGVVTRASDTATVTVHHPSVMDNSPGNEIVLEGSNLTLNCNATGNPTPNITWTKDGSPAVLYQGETYGIVRIQRQAGGKYTCTAWNGVGEQANATATVTVHYPAKLQTSPTNTAVVERNSATLYCNATGNPAPNITWTKDGITAVLYHGERFTIENISRHEAGNYLCTAWNEIGSKDNASVTVTVHYQSSIDTSPTSQTVLEGSNTTVYCNATGNPSPNITWTKDGNPAVLYQGEAYGIANIQRQSAGDYRCTAWNGVGNRTNAAATITVHYAASITASSPNVIVVEGDNVTLHCNATGNPAPNITWTMYNSRKVYGENLKIEKIDRRDAGNYICTAWNGIGISDNYTFTVTVHYPSAINAGPASQTVVEGNNVTLHCNGSGTPAPNITWTKDGSTVVLYQGEMYSIVNVQRHAAGDYTCTAWNGVGEQTNATATVVVHYPAVITSAPSNQTVLENSNTSFFCNATGNPPPLIIWTQDGNDSVLHQGNTFVVTNITRRFNGGLFKCTARNNVSKDDEAIAHATVHYPPEVRVTSLNNVVEGDNVSLNCHVNGNPAPNVVWIGRSEQSHITNSRKTVLTNIRRTDSGLFRCLAWNGIGANASDSVHIDVLYPAKIVTLPVDQVVWVGQQVTLFCNATGNPVPKITYTIVGENSTVGSGETLVVNSSRTAYVKTYTCKAVNGIGSSATANVTVTVLVRPCSRNPCLRGSCADVNGTAYKCDCNFGYQGTNCDEPIPPKTDSVDGQVTLRKDKYKYHEDYNNHSSARFRDLSLKFSDNMSALYKDEPQFGHVRVNDILNGSVLVNFALVFIRGNKTVEELVKILESSVENGTVQEFPVERDTLRLFLSTTPAPPSTVRHLPPSVAERHKSLSPWIIAVLLGIGGLVFLVLVCAIIHCCVRKKKAEKREICQRYENGNWIDLPRVSNGKAATDAGHTYTGPGAYVQEGPSVRGLVNQDNGIYERSPDEVPDVRTDKMTHPSTNGKTPSVI